MFFFCQRKLYGSTREKADNKWATICPKTKEIYFFHPMAFSRALHKLPTRPSDYIIRKIYVHFR